MSGGLQSPKRSVYGPLQKCAGPEAERAQTLRVQPVPFLQTRNQRPAPMSGPRGPFLKGTRIMTLAARLRVPISALPAGRSQRRDLCAGCLCSCGRWVIHAAVWGSEFLLLIAVLQSFLWTLHDLLIAVSSWALAREVSGSELLQLVLLRTSQFTAQGGHERTFLLGHTWECVKLLGAAAQGCWVETAPPQPVPLWLAAHQACEFGSGGRASRACEQQREHCPQTARPCTSQTPGYCTPVHWCPQVLKR